MGGAEAAGTPALAGGDERCRRQRSHEATKVRANEEGGRTRHNGTMRQSRRRKPVDIQAGARERPVTKPRARA